MIQNNIRLMFVAGMIALVLCGTASAWWDASWGEREKITITGTRDDTGTIVELIIDMSAYSDKIRADGHDIRFVNETTNTVIPAHDFSFNQTCNSTYYVRTNISTLGTEIYMYYNNSGASSYFDASAIYVTMDRFNRIDNLTVGDAEVGGTWTEGTGNCTVKSNQLFLDDPNNNAAYAYIINTSLSTYSGAISKMKKPDSANMAEVRMYHCANGTSIGSTIIIMDGIFWYSNAINLYNDMSLSATNDQYYTIAIQMNGDLSYSAWIDGTKRVDGESLMSNVAGRLTATSTKGSGVGTAYVDDARKFNKSDFGATHVLGTTVPIISNEQPVSPISKYVNSSDFEINATINEITDNKWEIDDGTGYVLKEWDNATASPAYTFSPSTEGVGNHDIRLTAYNLSTGKDANTTWDVTVSYAWDRTLISQFDMCLCYYASNLLCGDIDNDGSEECLAVGRNANELVILETDGTSRTYDVQEPCLQYWTSLKDVDEDGQNEVVYTFNGNPGIPDALVDLYQFNATHINQSSVNNILGVGSDNPHGIGWMKIDDNWQFYTAYCGGGEVTHAELDFTGFDFWYIDTVSNSGEDAVVFDIDQDGVDELVVAGGFAGGSARVYIYEINNATGAYTAKTTVLSSSLDASTHYSVYLTHGDIDNDGIENLIVLWEPHDYTVHDDGIIEAYEFTTSYASGYAEGFVIASTGTGFLENGDVRTYVVDVDGDGENELLTGHWQYYGAHANLTYFEVGASGTNISRHVIHDFGDYDAADSAIVIPAMVNDGGTMKVACIVNNKTHADFFLFERKEVTGLLTAPANHYFQFNDWDTNHTFSQIAALNPNDVCMSWYDHSSRLHEAFYVGQLYNANVVIPKNCSVFVFFDAETTIDIYNRDSITIPGATWFYGFLPGAITMSIPNIKTSMNDDGLDCWALYRWNGNANVDTGNVDPKEGITCYINNTGEWIP